MTIAIAQPSPKTPSQETAKKMTFAEFLEFDDGIENNWYELENGELILMPYESEINRRMTSFLFAYFLQMGIPYQEVGFKAPSF